MQHFIGPQVTIRKRAILRFAVLIALLPLLIGCPATSGDPVMSSPGRSASADAPAPVTLHAQRNASTARQSYRTPQAPQQRENPYGLGDQALLAFEDRKYQSAQSEAGAAENPTATRDPAFSREVLAAIQGGSNQEATPQGSLNQGARQTATSTGATTPPNPQDDDLGLADQLASFFSRGFRSIDADGRRKVALLLPLSGRHQALGEALQNAAVMATFELGSEKFDLMPFDTKGTPNGARRAVEEAVSADADLILGPVFSESAKAVYRSLRRADVNAVALTNDRSIAGGNLFVMGLAPEPQIAKVIDYARQQGKTRYAALLPESEYGYLVADILQKLMRYYELELTDVAFYKAGEDLKPVVQEIAHYPERQEALQKEIERQEKRLEVLLDETLTPEEVEVALADLAPEVDVSLGAAEAMDGEDQDLLAGFLGPEFSESLPETAMDPDAEPAAITVPDITDPEKLEEYIEFLKKRDTLGDPPYEAILLVEGGDLLRSIAPLLPFYDVRPEIVKILGTARFEDIQPWTDPTFRGAWFAAPDPQYRVAFEERYVATYKRPPPRLATIMYDGVALSAMLAREERGDPFGHRQISQPGGFLGLDGIFRFRSNRVQRGLAILEVTGGGLRVIDPAPNTFASGQDVNQGVSRPR